MAALEHRPVSSSVNGDVDVSLDVAGVMTEEDVDEEDIQKEVRTNVGRCIDARSPPPPPPIPCCRCCVSRVLFVATGGQPVIVCGKLAPNPCVADD